MKGRSYKDGRDYLSLNLEGIRRKRKRTKVAPSIINIKSRRFSFIAAQLLTKVHHV